MTDGPASASNSQPASAGPGRERARWLKAGLIASLAVNLLLLGGAAGAIMRHRHDHPGERGLMGFVRELPKERRGEIRQFLRAEREKLEPLREDVRANWRETNAALTTEPFEKDKLQGSMEKMIGAEMRVRSAISQVVVETAARLTADERKALKAWRERSEDRGRKRWKHHWDDRDGGERD